MANSLSKYERPKEMASVSHPFGNVSNSVPSSTPMNPKTVIDNKPVKKAGRPKKESKKERYTLFLDKDLKERATLFAQQNDRTLSQCLELIIRDYFNAIDNQ